LVRHHAKLGDDAAGGLGDCFDDQIGVVGSGPIVGAAGDDEKGLVGFQRGRLHHDQVVLPHGAIDFGSAPPTLGGEFDDRRFGVRTRDRLDDFPLVVGIGFLHIGDQRRRVGGRERFPSLRKRREAKGQRNEAEGQRTHRRVSNGGVSDG
jgi:hypothetical protein